MILLSKFINKYSTQLILGLIICLALVLRIYNLDKNPVGFFCDEATNGYNAYKIMTTGRDESGALFPIFFKSLVSAPPIAIYSTIPFVAIFGLNETAVRLQAVFFGIITIISLYLLGKILISKNVGLWSAFIGATMPWLIHYNRIGFDYNCYASLFVLSLYVFVRQTKGNKNLVWGFLFFGITLYTYQPARLIVPLTLVGLCLIYRKIILKQKKDLLLGIFVFLLISAPLLFSLFQGYGLNRFNQVSVLSLHLPLKETLLHMITNYFSQLSPSFFLNGEKTFITRHFINGLNPFLDITFPFIVLGIIIILFKLKASSYQVLLLLLFLYPLSASVVADGPFTGRTIIGAPLFSIIIGLGVGFFINIFKKKYQRILSVSTIILLVCLNLTTFIIFYFKQYPLISSDFWGWQYGPREIMTYFLQVKDKYQDLYMSGEFNGTDIFFKFYDPENRCQNKCKGSDFWREPSIYNSSRKQIFSLSPDYLSKSDLKTKFVVKKTIYYPNNTIAFLIGEIVQ